MLSFSGYGPKDSPIFTLVTWDDPVDRLDLLERYNPQTEAPFRQCLNVVEGAESAVIEHDYVDVDYWSEHSYLNEREFRGRNRKTDRLHFFSRRLLLADVLRLDDVLPDPRSTRIEDRRAYLGYMVVRPRRTGTVGRTMLRPPASLEDNVRTATTETVSIFGQPRDVKAVPFMEQDALTGACAHTVAWMAHYSAVLRGLTPRRVTVDIHELAKQSFATERSFPTVGLNPLQLVGLLDRLNLPAVVHTISRLGKTQLDRWGVSRIPWNFDNAFLDELNEDSANAWFRQAFASEVCRYLNSGFPVAITEGEHIFLVCGYRRDEGPGRYVRQIITHDDQKGPYLLLDLPRGRPTGKGSGSDRWDDLIVPLPNGIWMTGQGAESWGVDAIEKSARLALESLDEYRTALESTADDVVTAVTAFLAQLENREIALRTYAIQSDLFKISFAHHADDRAAVETVRQLQLPRYIWIVEMMDREKRDNPDGGGRSVMGEVILDATANDLEPNVLFVHVPGVLMVERHLAGNDGLRLCNPDLRYYTSRPSYLPVPEFGGHGKAAFVGVHGIV